MVIVTKSTAIKPKLVEEDNQSDEVKQDDSNQTRSVWINNVNDDGLNKNNN